MGSREIINQKYLIDARPDRLDLRDRPYRPPLTPIQAEFPTKEQIEIFLPLYEDLILNQGKDGACTGYGLAAVINYQYWFRDFVIPAIREPDIKQFAKKLTSSSPTGKAVYKHKVSPHMLYQMARLYDEWDGEDYEGSSCRGAMRGWHHHGVCLENTWPKRKAGSVVNPNWAEEAVERPLGAYYRVETKSIADLQAAIQEVHAVYVSAVVHSGWDVGFDHKKSLPAIQPSGASQLWGGHAFAIVGYNQDGFIVQNSWGEKWGYKGFALLKYDDWLANGMDAWVAVYGARTNIGSSPRGRTCRGLQEQSWSTSRPASAALDVYGKESSDSRTEWDESDAHLHSLVLVNDGKPASRLVEAANGVEHAFIVANKQVLEWCKQDQANRNLMIYAHGGLNDEAASLQRIALLGPYFKKNGIYPLFITWKSGLLETLGNQFRDAIGIDTRDEQDLRAESIRDVLSDIGNRIAEANDYTWEAIARRVAVKSIWTEMKENAAKAANQGGGTFILARHLHELRTRFPELKIHLIGHSAGSIVFAHMFDELRRLKIKIDGLDLYAPACTMDLATKKFGAALKDKIIDQADMHFELLSEKNERDDRVASIYGKSLLYLVSRALENSHKTPLLGLYSAWDRKRIDYRPDTYRNDHNHADIKAWNAVWKSSAQEPYVVVDREVKTSDNLSQRGEQFIKATHGSFDNSIDSITRSITRIVGHKPTYPVLNLHGY